MGRIAGTLSLLLMLLSLSPLVYPKDIPGCKLYYVVKPADTLAKIASSLGMRPLQKSAIKIAKANDIEDRNIVEVGSKICVDENIIKTGSPTLECYKINNKKKLCMDKDSFNSATNAKGVVSRSKKCTKFHEVKPGETLSIIARSIGMSPPYESALKLAEASGIKKPSKVEIGDKVCVDKKYINGDKKEKGFKCFKTKNNRKFCVDAAALAAIKSQKPKEIEPESEPEVIVVAPTPQPETQNAASSFVVEAEKPSDIVAKLKKEETAATPPKPEPAPVVAEKKPTPKPEPIKEEPKKSEAKDKDPDVFIGISAMPFLIYSRIDAVDTITGAKGSILSRADYGATFKIMQLWGNYFTSEMILQAERRTYESNSGRVFNQRGGSMLNFGVGMGLKFWNRLELKARGFYGDELYFRAPSTTSLAIDCTTTLKLDLALYFDIVTASWASTGIGGGARVIKGGFIEPIGGEAGYAVKTGYGYFGTFYMRHKFGHVMFEESFMYESMIKNTDLFKQIHTAAYISGGVTLLL